MRHPDAAKPQFLPPLPISRKLALFVIAICLYSFGAFLVIQHLGVSVARLGIESTVLNGLIISLLLSFRNNEAVKRWWEGRQLWGQLVNDSRNLSLKVRSYVPLDGGERHRFGLLLAGFAVALRRHLREGGKLQAIAGFERERDQPAHVPYYLAGRVVDALAGWRRDGRVDGLTHLMLDSHARALMDVCGACERIRSTPLAASYRALLRHGLGLYVLMTPWFMVQDLGYYAVPVMGLVAYFLIGIELTAGAIEEPFGRDGDDLALESYCRIIASGVGDVLGELPTALTDTRIE